MKSVAGSFFILLSILIISSGCGNNSNPISAFEPEVINNADAFQFQITDATGVSTILHYTWTNTGTGATVDHSTALTAGVASVEVFDADSVSVYTSSLLSSGTEETTVGTIGTWFVKVVLTEFDGTVNFSVEKL